jgi:hypothetical protein
VTTATSHLSSTLGPLFTIVIGAGLILAAVHYLGKLLKLLMVGQARDILIKAVGRNAYLAMASGMGVTVLTQSSTITTSVLVPFAGAGILTPAQIYPVVVGANLGTTFTTVFAAFAVVGQDAKIGLQAAFVHLLYNSLLDHRDLRDTGPAPGAPVLRRNLRPHRGRAQVGHRRLPHHRLHRAAGPGNHPGRRALEEAHGLMGVGQRISVELVISAYPMISCVALMITRYDMRFSPAGLLAFCALYRRRVVYTAGPGECTHPLDAVAKPATVCFRHDGDGISPAGHQRARSLLSLDRREGLL